MTAALFSLALLLSTGQEAPGPLVPPPADAVVSASGLATRVEVEGTGSEHPGRGDFAKLRYALWKSDGTLIQRVDPPNSVVIRLSNMLPGWRMAVGRMVVGETRTAWIPASLGAGKIEEGETFVIETELLEILRPHIPPPDVAAPPADAHATRSGIVSRVLQEGRGEERPGPRSQVTVHYTGWTTDGKMFDSSLLSGETATFFLRNVIAGWGEGIQLMRRGEKRRFWIPARLAYGNDRSKPQGTLVFDVELVDFR